MLEKDPGCAIANWGIALTYLGNPFGVNRSAEALGNARTAIEKGLAANPKTPRERAYLGAAAELFRGLRDERPTHARPGVRAGNGTGGED